MDRTTQLPARLAITAAFAVGGLVAVGAAPPAGASTRAAKSVVVSTVKSTEYGKVLTSGKTLYTLKPSQTACTGACLKVWPALRLPKGAKKATAGAGVSASKLGSVTRNGVRQVTYGGKALYLFSGDSSSGQVNGNVTDSWGTWTAVVTAKPSSSSSSSSSTGGAGF
jgi:predicted lipoprotein with Yx(FWY)xxD motif